MRLGSLVRGLAMLTACNGGRPDANEPADCTQRGPAFHLVFESERGLPQELQIDATYQGNLHEEFRLGERATDNQDLCCRAVAEDRSQYVDPSCSEAEAGTPEAGSWRSVVCVLWSNGAAEIEVSTGGEPAIHVELEAERNLACDTIKTRDVHFSLSPGDAGSWVLGE